MPSLKERIEELQEILVRTNIRIRETEALLAELRARREKIGEQVGPLLKQEKQQEIDLYKRGRK